MDKDILSVACHAGIFGILGMLSALKEYFEPLGFLKFEVKLLFLIWVYYSNSG